MHSRISKHECSPLQQVFPLKRHLPLSDAKRAACPGRDNLESAIKKKTFHECSVLIFTIMSEKQLLRACFENKQLDFLCTCLQIDIKVQTVVWGYMTACVALQFCFCGRNYSFSHFMRPISYLYNEYALFYLNLLILRVSGTIFLATEAH